MLSENRLLNKHLQVVKMYT